MSQLEQTQSRYRSLRLSAAADGLPALLAQAEANEASHLSFADRLAEYEMAQRQDKRIARCLKQAGFPSEKRLEGFDYRHQTTINKRQVNALLDFGFIDERSKLVFIGRELDAEAFKDAFEHCLVRKTACFLYYLLVFIGRELDAEAFKDAIV
jgi:DNA replication protein DnaC